MKVKVTPAPFLPARMSLDPPQSNWPHLPQQGAPRHREIPRRPGFWQRVREMKG